MPEQLEQLKQIVKDKSDFYTNTAGKFNAKSETLDWVIAQIEKLQAEA